MKRPTFRLAVLLAALVFAGLAQAQYTAHLTGEQTVPPGGSFATGDATLRPNRDNAEPKFKVTWPVCTTTARPESTSISATRPRLPGSSSGS